MTKPHRSKLFYIPQVRVNFKLCVHVELHAGKIVTRGFKIATNNAYMYVTGLWDYSVR